MPRFVVLLILVWFGLAMPANAATRTVNTIADHNDGACDADCTLREAVAVAVAGDTIVFAPTLNGTIPLTGGEIVIAKNLTIIGPGARTLGVSGNFASRIFDVGGPNEVNVTVSISGLSLINGNAGSHLGWLASVKLGGAIYNSGNLTLTNCTVQGNQAGDANAEDGFGGGIFNNVIAVLTLRNCTLAYNLARGQRPEGGGIYNIGTVNMTNSTLSNNQMAVNAHPSGFTNSGRGAGIYNVKLSIDGVPGAATVNATNCTIANNFFHFPARTGDNGYGGGIFKEHDAFVNLRNTIVAENRATTAGPDVYSSTPFTSQGHNLIRIIDGSSGWIASDLTGTAALPTDPKLANPDGLGSPQNNGGPTNTHALLAGSPAINAGDDIVLGPPHNLTTDQRGYPRKIGTHVDIGAFEFDPPQTATTLVVTTTDEHDDGVCGSTDCTLLEAINRANANASGGTVTVTFKAKLTGTIENSLPNGLAIIKPVNISGPGARILAVSGNNASRVFNVVSGTVTISGLTIKNGKVRGPNEVDFEVPAGDGNGGGIANAATLTLNKCTLSGNSATGGGGIFSGGGIARGGAIYNTGTLTVTSCTLSNNTALGGDGGLFGATGGQSLGGAIFNGGRLSSNNCTFSGNATDGGGGGDDPNGTEPGAGGDSFGGAVYSATAQSLTLTACTLTANSAAGGAGGFGNDFGVRGPSGSGQGGGVVRNSGTATVRNTIISGNTANTGHNAFGAFTSQGFNFVGKTDGSSGWLASDIKGTNTAPKNPKLGPLTDNGGQTNTHALLIGSTAIDKGKAFGLTTDQRGQVRPFNDPAVANGSGSDGSDIGAFERQTPRLFISDVTVTEGNSGTVNAVFTVNLFDAKAQTVTVSYATANGTTNPATAADYTATSGSLSFSPGQTAKTVNVPVKGDTLDELNETFFVNLSNAVGAPIADAQGVGTIVDNDPTPSLKINDITVTEGNTTVNMAFTVTLSAASGLEVKVNYATANNTATAPADYTATSGQLIFPAGSTSKTISVPLKGDLLDEPTETLRLNLSAPVNATLADSQGIATIADNDPAPSLRINNVTVVEGNGGTSNAAFTVSLSGASGRQVQVNYATANGTATQPGDYTATSGTLIIQPGSLSSIVLVPVKGDTLVEANETFFVNLLAPVNATIADAQGQGTITNDDSAAAAAVQSSEASITLSSAAAFVSSHSVQLTFEGALDAIAASDAAHYGVTVNGLGVAVSSASYDAQTNTVTLLLPDGALISGDKVSVAWHDLPVSGAVTILAH